jgi:hypothetical protein
MFACTEVEKLRVFVFWTKFIDLKCHENLKGRGHFKDRGIVAKIILEWILVKYDGKLWTGFMFLRTGTSGGLL